MQEPSWLERVIDYYSNDTDELVGEIALPHVELVKLHGLWGVPSNDPMVHCFSIQEGQAAFFNKLVGIEFDFTKYSYFLAAFTNDWEATKRDGGYLRLFPPPRELPAFPEARRVRPKTAS